MKNNSITGEKLTDDAGEELIDEAVDKAVDVAVETSDQHTTSAINSYDRELKLWLKDRGIQ